MAQRLAKLATGDGRIAVVEVLLQSWAVSNMIRENKVHQIEGQLQSAGGPNGNLAFDGALLSYVQQGVITAEEALRMANHPATVKRQIGEPSEEGA